MSKQNATESFAFRMTEKLSNELEEYCKKNEIGKGEAIRKALTELFVKSK